MDNSPIVPAGDRSKNLAIVLFLWLLPLLFLYLDGTVVPRTTLGWAIFIFLGPLAFIGVYALVDIAGEALRRLLKLRRLEEAVEQATAQEAFSPTRVAFLLVQVVAGIVVVVLFVAAIRSNLPQPLVNFWTANFR